MINRITDNKFELVSKYEPSGDQPQAIQKIVENLKTQFTKVLTKLQYVAFYEH